MTDRPPLTYDSDRLIRDWRDRYAGRRTIAWQMLDDAEALVRDAIAREREQEQRQAKTDQERELERREQQVDRLRRQLAEAEAKVESLSTRRTLMREERETVEQGTVVRLLAPTEPLSWTEDKSQVRPWMLGELEDVVHRLRMGGADDGTEVRFKRDAIEACIPFAEFALTPTHRELGRGAATALAESTDRAGSRRGRRALVLSLGFVAGVVGVLLAGVLR